VSPRRKAKKSTKPLVRVQLPGDSVFIPEVCW
jgi:hypothetical protein